MVTDGSLTYPFSRKTPSDRRLTCIEGQPILLVTRRPSLDVGLSDFTPLPSTLQERGDRPASVCCSGVLRRPVGPRGANSVLASNTEAKAGHNFVP